MIIKLSTNVRVATKTINTSFTKSYMNSFLIHTNFLTMIAINLSYSC